MSDDVVYGILLLVSVGSGALIRYAKTPLQKKLLSTLIGVLVISFSCGIEALHPLIVTVGNCVLIKFLGARWCHAASFVWCFGYLAFFRAAHLFGLSRPHPITNALQLFNALRMIGVAFEVHDAEYMEKRDRESEEDAELKKNFQLKPSFLDTIHYSLCYIGLFTGPYYKYRTYYDMLHIPEDAHIPIYKYAIERVKQIPLIAAVYLVCSYFFSIQYVKSEEFQYNPFWFRIFYMVPMFQIFRSRLYLAWIMSEVMSMTAGLGAYPVESKTRCGEGPTDLKALRHCQERDQKTVEYEFETIHNLSIWGCELAPTTREGLRSWNMSVQYWLAAYVHRRLPRSYGAMRVAITMGVSAFWHGIHPGYYLSFLTVPPILVAEDLMIAAFRKGSATQLHLFDWACWFFKMRGFDYNCMGFLLLSFDATVGYWKSIYFIPHIIIVIFIVVGLALKGKKSKKKKSE
ncbi:lysophospholipid acyltransferase 7-like [Mercenaria mercenaria]|uniref:lysophospholipid acyltransferase 7-like n=1 Tax=Mercenaria mercenaria TaxID=6596 RepID=UPI00234F4CA8|nr:lysophospholipid acyltransferase 7-like [Mercenaria mercenaria]